MVEFLCNAWYAAGWAADLKAEPVGAKVIGRKMVIYRDAAGAPVALGDVCPHRFAPMHRGAVRGNDIECPYHGLRFGPDGACTHNPHGEIPKAARLARFPAVERHGMVWVWPGEAARADAALIPDYSHLTSPGYRTITGDYVTEAYYETFTDNLMDLTHTQFLHKDFQNIDAFLTADRQFSIEGSSARMLYRCAPGKAPPLTARFLPDPDMMVSVSLEMRWHAPSLMRLTVIAEPLDGSCPPQLHVGTHILTPVSEGQTRYFYGASRTFGRDDPAIDTAMREWHRVGFGLQDKPMIEAVQENMGTSDLMSLKPILLASDTGVMQVRRLLQKLIRKEGAAARDRPRVPAQLSGR